MNREPSTRQVPRTLCDKIWDAHVVSQAADSPAVFYIDLHLIHEVTSPQAFSELARRNLPVRRPDRTVATMDHSTPTRGAVVIRSARAQLNKLAQNCAKHRIRLFEHGGPDNGIVHVIGPELGLTLPGMTIVCGDSHTATHGAFGALAFGIGTTEVSHVLATQCLLQSKPRSIRVRFDGTLREGVHAKDMALAMIQRVGVRGGTGHVFEYCGEAVRSLDMEGRMTLCNMSIEAGARAGLVAPDEVTYAYLAGRRYAPKGGAWERKLREWSELASDEGASFAREVSLDASALEPMITFGTNPEMAISVRGRVPDPERAQSAKQREALRKALSYMALEPGVPLFGQPIDVVFIGSCTNSRISDLRDAASVLRGRTVAVRSLVVPGSAAVKRQAEQEGLDEVFVAAGAEWREPGCSMCIAMNGDRLEPGQYAVSTSNRNFEGRQGPGGRTFLASPATAAASAVAGKVSDVRALAHAAGG